MKKLESAFTNHPIDIAYLKNRLDYESLLEQLGIEVSHWNGDWIMCHCLRGSTNILTETGWKSAASLAGQTVKIVSGDGILRTTEWKNYGQRRLWKIILEDDSILWATEEHRWKLIDGSWVTTGELKGKSIPRQAYKDFKYNLDEYLQGIRHGIVYGDGYAYKTGTTGNQQYKYTKVFQYGFSRELLHRFFDNTKDTWRSNQEATVVSRLPLYFKTLPAEEVSLSYKRGFIAGLIAADGHVSKRGHTILYQKDAKILEIIRRFSSECGLITYPVRTKNRVNSFNNSPSSISSLSFSRQSFYNSNGELDKNMIIHIPHRENINKTPYTPYLYKGIKIIHAWISEVVEDVYCCQEPKTESFVIEHGYVTGNCPDPVMHKNGDTSPSFGFNVAEMYANCFVCGPKTLLNLVEEQLDINEKDAVAWLREQSTFEPAKEDDLVEKINQILHPIQKTDIMPEFPDSALFKYRFVHPYLLERGISEEVIKDMNIGFDEEHLGIIIPHWWKGKLRGWQVRHLLEKNGKYYCPTCGQKNSPTVAKTPKETAKYNNTVGFPKKNTLYNLDNISGTQVFVVESPMSVLKLKSLGIQNVVATFGSFSKEQAQALAKFELVMYWPDNDEAGRVNAENAIKHLSFLTKVMIIPPIEGEKGDPADLESYEEATDYILGSITPATYKLMTNTNR